MYGAPGERGIAVDAVSPVTSNSDERLARRSGDRGPGAQSSLGGTATVGNIADVIGFLASHDTRWVNGRVIDVSGGSVLDLSETTA